MEESLNQKEYSMAVVDRAEQLYCVDGASFEAVSSLTGVSVSTLKRWSDRYDWQANKEKIRAAMSSIRSNTVLLRARLIEKCLGSLEAKDAFAVSAIESVAQKAAQIAAKGQEQAVVPESPREIKTDEDAVAALEEAVQLKLNAMLANPGRVSLAGLKEVKSVMDLLRDMRPQTDDPGKSSGSGLSAEAADEIRRKILGVKGN